MLNSLLVRYRIMGGFLMVLVFLWLARPGWWSIIAGLPLAAAGAALRTWASGHIEKGRNLATSGPYSMLRNPLYLGSFIMGLGVCLMGLHLPMTLVYLVFFFIVYRRKIRNEERNLVEKFGDEFKEYMKKVPPVIPRIIWPVGGGDFDWAKVMHHREYQAWFGLIGIVSVLALKIIFLC